MNRTSTAENLLSEDLYFLSSTPGVRIHLRRKYLPSRSAGDGGSAIIFVHGATFSGVAAFDAPLPGGSWLDFVAAHGHDVYAIDVRGYGMSTRPDIGGAGARVKEPYARTVEATADLSAAVDFVLARTGADRVDLVGWSWGTAICGGYVSNHNDKVGRLVMHAPLWTINAFPGAGLPFIQMAWSATLGSMYCRSLPPTRRVTFEDARRRWFRGIDATTAEALCPREVLEDWWQHVVSLEGASRSSSVMDAPNGVIADLIEYWSAGIPTYDPGKIRVPVLATLGEWDIDTPLYMAQALFGRLTAAPYKRLEVLGRGTHSMSLEVNRFDLYQRIQEFLGTRFLAAE